MRTLEGRRKSLKRWHGIHMWLLNALNDQGIRPMHTIIDEWKRRRNFFDCFSIISTHFDTNFNNFAFSSNLTFSNNFDDFNQHLKCSIFRLIKLLFSFFLFCLDLYYWGSGCRKKCGFGWGRKFREKNRILHFNFLNKNSAVFKQNTHKPYTIRFI